MLLRKCLLPASLCTLLLLALSQVGFSQTIDEITIGILDIYTVNYSETEVMTLRQELHNEILALEKPGLKVMIGVDSRPTGVIESSHEYFHHSARANGYDYYLIGQVLRKPAVIFVDLRVYATAANRLVWNSSAWYVDSEHLLNELSLSAEQMVTAVSRHRDQQAPSPELQQASEHPRQIDWDFGAGIMLCWPARRDPEREQWANGFGIGVFQELTSYEGLERLFPYWISTQVGFASYVGYNQMGFADEDVSHQLRGHVQLLLPLILDFVGIGAAYHGQWGGPDEYTNLVGATVTLLYLSSNDVWWPFVYEFGTVRYLYDFSTQHWYFELDLLRIGIRVFP